MPAGMCSACIDNARCMCLHLLLRTAMYACLLLEFYLESNFVSAGITVGMTLQCGFCYVNFM